MADPDLDAFIDRIIRDAQVPMPHRRDELRRELVTHFDDAAGGADAIARFGDPAALVTAWRRLYRRERTLLYVAKLTVSTVASLGAAATIALASALRGGGFSYRIVPSTIAVLLVVLVREATWPFAENRAAARLRTYVTTTGAAKFLQMFGGSLGVEYALHAGQGVALGPERLIAAAAVLAAVWAATISIGTRVDRVFRRVSATA